MLRSTTLSLHEIIAYDPKNGTFYWRIDGNKKKLGEQAGTEYKNGYNMITVNGERYRAARLAWYLSYGYWPTEVDHINRRKNDDRLFNLREVTHSVNMRNVKTRVKHGVRGIYWDSVNENWRVLIRRDGVNYNGGSHQTFVQAREALQNLLRSRGEIL